MRVRHQYQLHAIQHLLDRKWQRYQWIWARLRGILDRRHRSRVAEHGINQNLHAGIVQQQRGVAHQLQLQEKTSLAANTVLQWIVTVSSTRRAYPPA